MNPFLQLQADVAARLKEDPWLHELPVLTEAIGDLDSAINEALAKGGVTPDARGQAGLAIVVITPKARGGDEPAPRLAALDVVVRVGVYESGAINRSEAGTGRPALDAVWNVIVQLQGWAMHRGTPPASLVEMDSESDPDGLMMYYVDFRFRRAFPLRALD